MATISFFIPHVQRVCHPSLEGLGFPIPLSIPHMAGIGATWHVRLLEPLGARAEEWVSESCIRDHDEPVRSAWACYHPSQCQGWLIIRCYPSIISFMILSQHRPCYHHPAIPAVSPFCHCFHNAIPASSSNVSCYPSIHDAIAASCIMLFQHLLQHQDAIPASGVSVMTVLSQRIFEIWQLS